MSKSLLCSLLFVAFMCAAGSEKPPVVEEGTVASPLHRLQTVLAMGDTHPTRITQGPTKKSAPAKKQPTKKGKKVVNVNQAQPKKKIVNVNKGLYEKIVAASKGASGPVKIAPSKGAIDLLAQKKAAVKKAAAITKKARDAASEIIQKAKEKAEMMETTAQKDAHDLKVRAAQAISAKDAALAIETPPVSRVNAKAFSKAASLLKKRGRELSNLEFVRMVMANAKGGKKAGYLDEDRELGLDHEGAGEAGHRIHKKAFKEACKKVNNNLMRSVTQEANKAIRVTFRQVRASQHALNSLRNGRHCRFKNQHLIKHAIELIKKRKKQLKSAQNALNRHLSARVKFSFTYDEAVSARCSAAHAFFTSPNYQAALAVVTQMKRFWYGAQTMLKAARENLKTRRKDAAAARHRCHCAVKAHAIKSHHVAMRRTPARMKVILRELMVRCMVYGNPRAKCKKIKLSKAYKLRLRLHRTKLVNAAERAKCARL